MKGFGVMKGSLRRHDGAEGIELTRPVPGHDVCSRRAGYLRRVDLKLIATGTGAAAPTARDTGTAR
jgi:hypothetical protein